MNHSFFFVGSIALAIIVAVVAVRINAGALNISELISFIIALLLLSQPARGLSTLNAVAQEGFGAFERMLALIDLEPEIRDKENARSLSVSKGDVRFKEVSFSYGNDTPAVCDLTFDVRGGETAAMVGESGAGKSTVFNLLLRLYRQDAGQIFVDGVEISDCTISSLRSSIGLVSQETSMFDDTVAVNIGFGKSGATQSEIIEAAKAAAAHNFIMALPNQYETRVGEGGMNLSGGQRQRIAIARAFLKDAPILLLDEATAALDAETERQVQEALTKLSEGRTTIIIAHRLATVRNADKIFVMDKGRITEAGVHDELMEKNGVYRQLASLQLQ